MSFFVTFLRMKRAGQRHASRAWQAAGQHVTASNPSAHLTNLDMLLAILK